MATFDVSFLNKNMRKSAGKDYGFLVDQLSIKENQLSADGKLSPGDYDLLLGEAQKLYSHPGLTSSQRSNVQVKMSGYEKSKKVDGLRDSSDITRINREVGDDTSKNVIRFGNDPLKFLQTQAAIQSAKISQLSDSIDRMEAAGDDTSNYYNELNATLQDFNDTNQALADVQTYDKSGNPKTDFAAYAVTNSQGEIIDLKIKRSGGESGYIPTNGVYGGLPVYGKANRKENGMSVFQFGGQKFIESDSLVTGPDGISQQRVLVSGGGGRGGITVNGKNVDIDPSVVRTQSSIRTGQWAEGEKGFLYQRLADGSYKKHVNSDKEQLGISDENIIKIPRSFEQGILKDVRETVDGAMPVALPVPTTLDQGSPQASANLATTTPAQSAAQSISPDQPAATGTPRTPAPTQRSPQGASAVAGEETGKAKGFFSRLFGK